MFCITPVALCPLPAPIRMEANSSIRLRTSTRTTFSQTSCCTSALNWSKAPSPANSTMDAGKRFRPTGTAKTVPNSPLNMRRAVNSLMAPSRRRSMALEAPLGATLRKTPRT